MRENLNALCLCGGRIVVDQTMLRLLSPCVETLDAATTKARLCPQKGVANIWKLGKLVRGSGMTLVDYSR